MIFNYQKHQAFWTALLVFFIYLILSLINTYPLVFSLNTHLLGDGGDGHHFVWNLWWMKKALLDLNQNPYKTDFLFHPQGTTLYLHSFVPFAGLVSIPLQLISKNLILTYNIIALSSFVLSGLFMYLLALHVSKNHLAAFFAGLIFAFAPYRMGHSLGHLNLISTEWLPLFVLFLLKIKEQQKPKYALLAAACLVLIFLGSVYHAFFAGVFLFVFAAHHLISNRFKNCGVFIALNAATVAVFFVIISPLLIEIITNFSSGDFSSNYNPDSNSPDLFSFFIPGPYTWLMNGPGREFNFSAWYSNFRGVSAIGAENQNYLGMAALALAVFGAIKSKSSRSLWIVSAAVFFILTLGTTFKILGHDTQIHLPYYWIYKVAPLVSLPGRFDIFFVICFAMLCSLGLARLTQIKSRKLKIALIFAAFSITLLELANFPFPVTAPTHHKFCDALAELPDDLAVADFVNLKPGHSMYCQTIHNKKITGGFLGRMERKLYVMDRKGQIFPRFVLRLQQIKNSSNIAPKTKISLIINELKKLKIDVVVLKKELAVKTGLNKFLDVIYQDQQVLVLAVDREK